MARKSKIITISGRGEVTVKEVSPWAVYQAWGEKDRMTAVMLLADDALTPSVDEVRSWYSSEIEQVVAAFMEVNSSFFGIARQLKMDGLLAELIKTLSGSLPAVFADSFRLAMQAHGTTAGLSS